MQPLSSAQPSESSMVPEIAHFDQRSAIKFGKRIAGGLPIRAIHRRTNSFWLDLIHEGPKWLRSNGESLLQSFDLSERRFGWMSELDGFGIKPFHDDRGSRTGGRSR